MIPRNRFCLVLLCVIAVFGGRHQANAQRGPGSEAELLRRSEIQESLQLSDEQKKKLADLKEKSSNTREIFDKFKERLREAEGEEQDKVRDELNAAIAKNRSLFNDEAPNVLTKDQRVSMRRLYLQSAGVRGLMNDTLAKEYGVSEDQKKKLGELFNERRSASRALGFDASDEDREKFATEWDGKFMAVLNDKQKAMFEKQSADLEAPATSIAGSAAGAPSRGPIERPVDGPVVGSFGAAAGETKLVKEWTFNFRGMPWEEVLQMYADGTALTLELDAVPPGSFNHIDSNVYGPRKALDIINGNLLRRGHVAIENDGFLIVKNIDNGIESYLLREVTIEELLDVGKEPKVGDHELVTATFDIENMDAGRAAQEIEPLIGPHGGIIALTESRILIITDTGGSLRRIHGYLQTAMGQGKLDTPIFKPYPLKYIDAEEAQLQVMTQFGMQQGTVNVTFAAEMARRQQSRSRNSTPQPSRTQQAPEGPEIQIATDLRLNRLLVTGTMAQHQLVESIIASLDINQTADGIAIGGGRRGTYLEVYKVSSADVLEVAKTLTAMNMNGVTVLNEDSDAGTLHVMASSRKHEEVAMVIRQMDGVGAVVNGTVAVIPLSQLDPISAAATLRSLFYNLGDEAPTIETDLYGRRLIIRGSAESIAQIRQVLSDLGEDGTGVRQRSGDGMIRRFQLSGRNPDQFLKVLQETWNAQESTKINLIMPKPPSPIRSRETTNQPEAGFSEERPEQQPPAKPPAPKNDNNVTATDRMIPDQAWQPMRRGMTIGSSTTRDFTYTRSPQAVSSSQTQARKAADEQEKMLPQPGGKTDQIDIIVNGDELIFASENQEKLDLMEDLLDQLHQSMPFRKEYTVVYLRSADALQAADMLSQFFPSSSVASTASFASGGIMESLTGTIGGLGGDLMDASGLSGIGAGSQSLTIIPDIRQNALWMTGPQSMIDDAKQFLDVLDSNDIPNSLKDMQPHFIPVKFADVRDVEAKVKEVFRTYTEAQGGNNQRGNNNPLAMLGLGGGGGAKDDPASKIRLLVDSDEQTGTLIVNCNESLFQQVETVVKRIDDETMKANPIVRTIPLLHADPTVIQQTLLNMVPRVSVSASRTNDRGNNSSGAAATTGRNSGSTGGNDAAKAQQDFMRRMMEQRANALGGGRGGTTGGGRGGATGGGGRGGRGGGGGRGR